MESAMIYGKNRHFFGGLEPSNMKYFGATSSNGTITLSCQLPDDTYINGQLLCTVAGAVIRYKTDGYPKDEFDGDELGMITASGGSTVEIEDMVHSADDIVYYAAFPYSDQGVYNRSDKNRTYVKGIAAGYYFGYDIDLSEPDPDTRVTYLTDDYVDNRNYTPAKMNFSTGIFDYGGWNITPGEKFMPRPCMLKYDGTVDYHLDPNDYTKKVDGTASDVTNIDYAANAMMQWPKIYTKRWEENGVYHFRCSDVKIDDDYECWCNYDKDNNEIPYFYTGIYNGCVYNSTVRSISGRSLNVGNSQPTTLRTQIKKNGDDWEFETLSDRLLINDLLTMMGHTTDLQTAFGSGVVNGDNTVKPGSGNTKGLFWGDETGVSVVKIFGMEHFWGNLDRITCGLAVKFNSSTTSDIYIKCTRGTKDGSTNDEYDIKGDGYICVATGVANTNGYISEMLTTEYGRIPIKGEGASTHYEGDHVDITRPASGDTNIALFGHGVGFTTYSGPFAMDCSYNYGSSMVISSAVLSCKPSLT